MFSRPAMKPAVADLRAYMIEMGYDLPSGPFGPRVVLLETDWTQEDEKADWEYPSVVIVRHGFMTFGEVREAAEYFVKEYGEHPKLPWFQIMSGAARSALEWHNAPGNGPSHCG